MENGFTNQRCPKCGGNTYIDMDYYVEGNLINWYSQESCLQCGQIIYGLADSPNIVDVAASVDRAVRLRRDPLLV